MSEFDWNSVFKLPDAALAGNRRIPKTVLVRQAGLTKTEQKTLDKVSRLEHFATVQKSTTRVSPYTDEERDLQSIVFLHCEMSGSQAYSEVGRLLHKCFPNPTIIVFDSADAACISIAKTRKSFAEQGAAVIDGTESTGSFRVSDDAFTPFLDSLAFARLPQDNLQMFLDGFSWSVKLSRVIHALGFFPTCSVQERATMEKLLEQYEGLAIRIGEIRKQRRVDKNLSLNESAHLRMDEKQLKRELDTAVNEIKAVCNGQ